MWNGDISDEEFIFSWFVDYCGTLILKLTDKDGENFQTLAEIWITIWQPHDYFYITGNSQFGDGLWQDNFINFGDTKTTGSNIYYAYSAQCVPNTGSYG